MTEIPGGDPPICDACNEPIVGPVFRVGVERFCKPCKEQTVMAGRKLTLDDFPLKTEGTDLCWIVGCNAEQRTSGLCRKHYDSARYHGTLDAIAAQIDARSEALPSPATELRALQEALTEAVGAHPEPLAPLQQVALLQRRLTRSEQGGELTDALGSVRRLADELTAVDAALGPYRLEAAQGNRIAAIEALTAPSGPVLLSEEGLRERFFRLNEISHTESLLTGLSEPLQAALRVVLEAEKAKVLRVCP